MRNPAQREMWNPESQRYEFANVPAPRANSLLREVVTREVLRYQGLNTQAYSGTTNPATIYRIMTGGYNQVFPYYRELEEKDLSVASALETRKLLVQGREWTVISADEANGQAQQYHDEASAFLRAIPQFGFVLQELLDAPAYGYAVAEIMWRNDGNRVVVDKIIGRPQEFFDFRLDYLDPPLGDLRFLPNMIPAGEEVPQEKFIVNTYKPRHGDRRGLPLLRKLFWPSWFKRQGLRLNLQFLEKPRGTIAVQYASGANSSGKQEALAVAEGIASEIAVAVPESVKVMESLLSTTRIREGKDYQIIVDYLDAEMTRLILGQTLSTRGQEQGKGTQALGNVHQDLLYQTVKRDAQDLEEVINEQLLGPWLRWTFGDISLDRSFRPHWAIDLAPEQDILEQARILKEARGLIDVPRTEAYKRLQIPEPEEGEALVNASVIPVELTGLPDEGDGGGFGQ